MNSDQKDVISTDSPKGEQSMTTVNGPALHNPMLGSHKQETRRFKRRLTLEVRSPIRRTGCDAMPGAVAALLLIGADVARVSRRKTQHRYGRQTHLHSGEHRLGDRITAAGTAVNGSTDLLSQGDVARAAPGHESQDHQQAPRRLRAAGPQPAWEVGTHQCRPAVGRSSAVLPPGAQRPSDGLEPRRCCRGAGAGLMDEQTANPAPWLSRPRAWITSADPGHELGISHEMQRGES